MMLSTVFLIMLFTNFCGFSETDANLHKRQRRGYGGTPEEISELGRELRHMQKSIDAIADTLRTLQDKLNGQDLTNQRLRTIDWNEKLQKFERKLDKLQRSQEEQETYGNKLTALEFTLNHVLSKVVYLSDNIQTRTDGIESVTHLKPNLNTGNIEILARLNDLLRHVRSIKRDDCRRSSMPAAAGPVISTNTETKQKFATSNAIERMVSNTTSFAEELAKQVVESLNLKTFAVLNELPDVMKQHVEQLNDIKRIVKQTDIRLEHWPSEDPQQQNWRRMLQYCQDVSDEFSNFAGNSDALLKRIESFLRHIAQKIVDSSSRQRSPSMACAGRKGNGGTNNTSHVNINMSSISSTGFEASGVNIVPLKNGCNDLTDDGFQDGVYRFGVPDLNDAGRDFNTRYCSFATDERAWTVIQRRGPYDIQENFNRSWSTYRNGFGDLSKDFWFGNEFLHRLTSYNDYELLIELENFDSGKMSISYGSFGLDSEKNNYSLFIGDYKGPGPDSLSYHGFMDFSTYDHSRNDEEDIYSCCTCAVGYGSGWWFDNCLEANLNGIYRREPLNHSYVGIIWEHWLGDYSLKASRMLVRPKNWTILSYGDKTGLKWFEEP